jgi:hypothetical protein
VNAEALTQSAQEAIRHAEAILKFYKEHHYDVVEVAEESRINARIILSLVETIKTAPHDMDCPGRIGLNNCTCWKATAFSAAMKAGE